MFQERDTMPTFEPIVTKEQKNKEQEIIALLKEKGLDDHETEEALAQYVSNQEAQVDQSEDYIVGQVRLSVTLARIYIEAGYVEIALENLYLTKEQAFHERQYQLLGKIGDMIDEIEGEETFSEAA